MTCNGPMSYNHTYLCTLWILTSCQKGEVLNALHLHISSISELRLHSSLHTFLPVLCWFVSVQTPATETVVEFLMISLPLSLFPVTSREEQFLMTALHHSYLHLPFSCKIHGWILVSKAGSLMEQYVSLVFWRDLRFLQVPNSRSCVLTIRFAFFQNTRQSCWSAEVGFLHH